jgi:Encapsulating protein for peroxidase
MDRNTGDLGWSDEQWSRASKIVQQEAQRARVAAQFLPIYVQGDTTATAVPRRLLGYTTRPPVSGTERMELDSDPKLALTSFAVNVFLTSQEAADPEQAAALIELRRAANLIARLEDALVFRGQPGRGDAPPDTGKLPQIFAVSGGGHQHGLIDAATVNKNAPVVKLADPGKGEDVAAGIIDAIGRLEAAGHNRPFACVLDQELYKALHSPTDAMILPRDRVVPFLEGPLLRSSTLPEKKGVVVALGGSPLELVVSSELHVRFLQITTDPYLVLRVSERIALRVTDWTAIATLKP